MRLLAGMLPNGLGMANQQSGAHECMIGQEIPPVNFRKANILSGSYAEAATILPGRFYGSASLAVNLHLCINMHIYILNLLLVRCILSPCMGSSLAEMRDDVAKPTDWPVGALAGFGRSPVNSRR